ncbi:hypothetical protein [Sutterella wadsworthensis]|uniref:hypothetical protein n=1 Tax=Sutterella wadsworthensis TaxID=40545 RepID=UPI003A8D545F
MLDVSYEKVIPSLVQRQFFQNVRFWVSYDGRPIEERFWRFAPRSNIFIKSKGANFCGMTADVFVVEYGTVLLDDGVGQNYILVTCYSSGQRQSVLFKNGDSILDRFFIELNESCPLAVI